MKKLIFLLIFASSTCIYAQKDSSPTLTEQQQKNVIEVVDCWASEMFKAENIDKLMELSDVPFAYDRKKIIYNKEELRKHYLDIFDNKGKRTIPQYETEITAYKSEIIDRCIPLNFVKVMLTVKEGNYTDGAEICVSIRENEYKVVGFSD